jgi:hypothetical protein
MYGKAFFILLKLKIVQFQTSSLGSLIINQERGKPMLHVKNTLNNAGVAVYGDFMDLEQLYEALHKVVGDEDEFVAYASARIRVLGVCYDLRHALMGDREIGLVDNGMDPDKMRRLSMISNDKNVYYVFHVLWPEILFVTMALNDFIRLYAGKQSKNGYDVMMDKKNIWDASIAHVRVFQTAIANCIKETVPDTSVSRMMNMLIQDYTWTDGYITQYLDLLNSRFLEMDKEKRLKNLSIMAKRVAEKGKEYEEVVREIAAAARKHDCSVEDIRLRLEYPEDIEW